MSVTLPDTMLAAVLDGAGPPDAFDLRKVPMPSLDENHVIIALDYAGVGSWDAEQRSGQWGEVKKGTILGADGSGTIAAVKGDVHGLKVGDRVYSFSFENDAGGFFAEYVSVPAERVERVPEQIDQKIAGAMPAVGLTALSGLDVLELDAGESLLVFGASGGVGSMAVWLAAHSVKAVVTGTARPDAFDYVLQLGAKYAVDPNATPAEQGYDGALLTAGGDHLAKFFARLHRGAPVAYPNGVEPEPKVEGHETIPFDGQMTRDTFIAFNKAIGARPLPLAVDVYPLDRIADANRRIEQGHVIGKIALKIR